MNQTIEEETRHKEIDWRKIEKVRRHLQNYVVNKYQYKTNYHPVEIKLC